MFLFLRAPKDFDLEICKSLQSVHTENLNSGSRVNIFSETTPKPVSDSFVETEDNHIVLFEGVLANSGKLLTKYAFTGTPKLIKSAILDQSNLYLKQFHGQFYTLLYSIPSGKLILHTNQVNSIRIYYYYSADVFIAGTSLKLINSLLRSNGIVTTVDEVGARMLLSYGFMLGDYTTVSEIRQLGAGNTLEFTAPHLIIDSYHRFNNDTIHSNLKDCVPVLDQLFSQAVTGAFSKDDACNKAHLAFLSGGLDSRQTVFTAVKAGFRDITCLNFSQPGYADELIARRITDSLGLKLIFFPLTQGEYLLNLDKNLTYNEGQIILHGAAHLYEAISAMDLQNFGILHSGQLGDFILGSYLGSPVQEEVNLRSGAYSVRLLDSIMPDILPLKKQFPNQELFALYNRCFNAVMNGEYACESYSYSVSPFVEPDFAQYGLNIDPRLRYKWQCYFYWMRRFNRAGAKFVWEKTGTNLLAPLWYAQLNMFVQLGFNKVYRTISHQPNHRSMNPFDLWWKVNPSLRERFSSFASVSESIRPQLSNELYNDAAKLFTSGSFSEKLQVYSLVRGVEYLFSE